MIIIKKDFVINDEEVLPIITIQTGLWAIVDW